MTRRNYGAASDPARNAAFSRRWSEPEFAEEQPEKIGRRAVAHWLRQAERLHREERSIALATADDIRVALGLSSAGLLDKRVAA